jgi:hypothetical protein
MSVIDVYELPQYISVTLQLDAGAMTLTNYPVNKTDLKLFRDTSNVIDVRIRDIDRKPVILPEGSVLDLVIRDDITLVASRRLTVVNAAKGLYRVVMRPEDMPNTGSLFSFFIVQTAADGTETLLFTDRARSPRGVAEILTGHVMQPRPSVEVFYENLLPLDLSFQSSAYASHGDRHTVAIYLNTFSGTFKVEATLDDSPGGDSRWFEVTSQSYDEISGIKTLSFEGGFTFVRFRVTPLDTIGEFLKIIYR